MSGRFLVYAWSSWIVGASGQRDWSWCYFRNSLQERCQQLIINQKISRAGPNNKWGVCLPKSSGTSNVHSLLPTYPRRIESTHSPPSRQQKDKPIIFSRLPKSKIAWQNLTAWIESNQRLQRFSLTSKQDIIAIRRQMLCPEWAGLPKWYNLLSATNHGHLKLRIMLFWSRLLTNIG